MSEETESRRLIEEWRAWRATNDPRLHESTAPRLRRAFGALDGNVWYEVWQHVNEATHYVSLHALLDGSPCCFTTAGHATVQDAIDWATENAENPGMQTC